MNRAAGIDVSNNNGVVNWAEYRGKIQFAEIKATEGLSFDDGFFGSNWINARELGLFRFAYHFGHPGKDPAKQAAFFTSRVRNMGLLEHDNFVLDLEVNDGLPAEHVSFWGHVFCTEMNRLNPGHRIIVQTFPSFANEGNCASLGAWHLWVMDWLVPHPVMPVGPWRSWALWQYAEGRNGSPDLDVLNGDVEALRHFCRTTGKTGP